jgi:hypothetical protein
MAKKLLFCEGCEKEFTISFKKEDGEPSNCPWCTAELDLDWYALDESDETNA